MKKFIYIASFACVFIVAIIFLTVLHSEQTEEETSQSSTTESSTFQITEPVPSKPIVIPKETTVDLVMEDVDKRVVKKFLSKLKQCKQGPVRVVHYGDSQIEGDRITAIFRNNMQRRYGGGGPGMMTLVKRVNSLTYKQITYKSQQEVTKADRIVNYTAFLFKKQRDNDLYGPMGQVFVMDNDRVEGSEEMEIQVTCNKKTPVKPFNQVRLITSEGIEGTVTTNDEQIAYHDLVSVPLQKSISIHLAGKGDVYGISLETDKGIIVDNVAMRGSSGLIFTKINQEQLINFFQSTNTQLIILQFGGNIVPHLTDEATVKKYVRDMKRQVQYLRQCAPQASFIFIGPSDMCLRLQGKRQSPIIIPILDEHLKRFCHQNNIAYYSLFQMMDGAGGMANWQEKGLAGSDGIHFTLKGAALAGEQFWKWFIQAKQ